MELQNFITETLTQIVNGVIDAQKELKDTGCLINPYVHDKEHTYTTNDGRGINRAVQKVKMNVVLSVSENKEKNSKIGVFKVIEAGVGKESATQNSQMTTLEFEIPIALPVMEKENK